MICDLIGYHDSCTWGQLFITRFTPRACDSTHYGRLMTLRTILLNMMFFIHFSTIIA